jgi:tetratricopeptide (TPR) repeat protein
MGHGWPDMWRVHVARVLVEQERFEEAEDMLARVECLDAGDDAAVYVVQAPLLARRGEVDEAERLARSAVEFFEQTDSLGFKADAYRSLAEVFRLSRKRERAVEALRHALTLYEERGATLPAERTRTMLVALTRT